jgi:hypothetical protein
VAEGTVRNHVTTILAKLEVSDRAQATAIAPGGTAWPTWATTRLDDAT